MTRRSIGDIRCYRRSLWNQETAMINTKRKEYYRYIDALCKSDSKQVWSEIKQLWWWINQNNNSAYVI